jgi:uncharacterized protein (DUF1778 family)
MRTTIDIPDRLFREIKSKAVMRGESLKSFLLRAATAELAADQKVNGKRSKFPIVVSKEATYDILSEHLAVILEDEDHEISTGY